LKLSAIVAAANVGLNVLFIPPWGILGAAIATTVSLLLGVIMFLALMPKILGVRIDIQWFARAMGFACIAVGLFLVGTRFMNPYIVGGVILCGYVALVFLIFLSKEDKAMFASLAYSLVARR
jgi:O-antigen/teichoic acid export membrane protein